MGPGDGPCTTCAAMPTLSAWRAAAARTPCSSYCKKPGDRYSKGCVKYFFSSRCGVKPTQLTLDACISDRIAKRHRCRWRAAIVIGFTVRRYAGCPAPHRSGHAHPRATARDDTTRCGARLARGRGGCAGWHAGSLPADKVYLKPHQAIAVRPAPAYTDILKALHSSSAFNQSSVQRAGWASSLRHERVFTSLMEQLKAPQRFRITA